MKRIAVIIFALLTAQPLLVHAGCRSSHTDALVAIMAEELISSLQIRLDRTKPIMATTFVDLHSMERTSDLGRILGEEIGAQLTNYGYRLVEPRIRSTSVSTRNQQGEFILSRDPQQLNPNVEIQTFLTGTYAKSENGVVISAKLVQASDRTILATSTCELRLSPEVSLLLQSSSQPSGGTRATILKNPKSKNHAKEIQQKLSTQGFYRGKIDGVWGKNSKAALQGFKKAHGLAPTETWDHETQNTLFPSQ